MTTGYMGGTPPDQVRQDVITEALGEIVVHRVAIEQVKGVLMFVYDITDEEAFDLLRCRSQEDNVKLRTLAEQLLEDFRSASSHDRAQPARAFLDRLLATAHERIEQQHGQSQHL